MRKQVLKLLGYYGTLMSYALTFYLGYMYLVAYLDPSKMVTMDINHYGEARWELWLVIFVLLCVIIAMKYQATIWLAMFRKKWREKHVTT
jgi:hypothetical protein